MRKTGFGFLLFLMTCIPFLSAAHAGEITGNWVTYDDHSGDKKSIVSITRESDGTLSGHVVEVFFKPGDETRCVKCEGERHNQPIVGLQIFRGLAFDGSVWRGGSILDPKNGKEYDCELRADGTELKVRGYLLFFFRTQTWKRPDAGA